MAARIDKFRSELNCRHVTLWPNPGFVAYEKVRRGIERFAERVMPQFDTGGAPVHHVSLAGGGRVHQGSQ